MSVPLAWGQEAWFPALSPRWLCDLTQIAWYLCALFSLSPEVASSTHLDRKDHSDAAAGPAGSTGQVGEGKWSLSGGRAGVKVALLCLMGQEGKAVPRLVLKKQKDKRAGEAQGGVPAPKSEAWREAPRTGGLPRSPGSQPQHSDVWDWIILCGSSCPQLSPALTHSPVTTRTVSRHYQMTPGGADLPLVGISELSHLAFIEHLLCA